MPSGYEINESLEVTACGIKGKFPRALSDEKQIRCGSLQAKRRRSYDSSSIDIPHCYSLGKPCPVYKYLLENKHKIGKQEYAKNSPSTTKTGENSEKQTEKPRKPYDPIIRKKIPPEQRKRLETRLEIKPEEKSETWRDLKKKLLGQ